MLKENAFANEILSSIELSIDASKELYAMFTDNRFAEFHELHKTTEALIKKIESAILDLGKVDGIFKEIHNGLILNVIYTMELIDTYAKTRAEKILHKIQYQAIPLLEELYTQFYYFSLVNGDIEAEKQFISETWDLFKSNYYIEESEKSNNYKYDVSIFVTAYNNINYTKACVEAIIKNTPQDINYELILINHGSTDGTKEYFESIGCTKQLDFKCNNLIINPVHTVASIMEGKYYCAISNDVLVGPNYLSNMIRCIESDPDIKIIVPTTTNIANFQTIPYKFSTFDEMWAFAKKNNKYDPFRHEVRTRLMNPIEFGRTRDIATKDGIGKTPLSIRGVGFNDDIQSMIIRRSKGKNILAKDSFCYHFGSVTLKDDSDYLSDTNLNKRRSEIKEYYGIDPWGIGSHYDKELFEYLDCLDRGHVNILGINCGIGSNPLKVRESIKEKSHNLDCFIANITDAKEFELDLGGVGDLVEITENENEVFEFFSGRIYDYIVFEDTFSFEINEDELVEKIVSSLSHSGRLIVSNKSGISEKSNQKLSLLKTLENFKVFTKI